MCNIAAEVSDRPVNVSVDGSFITSTTPTRLTCYPCLFFLLIAFWEPQTVMSCQHLYISQRGGETLLAPL